jgi:protease-4
MLPFRALAPAAALATLLLTALGAGCIYAPIDFGFADIGKVQEVTLIEAATDAKVVLVRIDGEITEMGSDRGILGSTEGTTAQVKDVLDLARRDESVRALLVRIDSPGGGVTASDIVYRELLDWKRATGKPVVALFMDTAASGGYYAAMAADRIVAHPTAITGSIGVVAMLPNVSGLADKVGVKVYTVKSGERKDAGNPFRPMGEDDLRSFQSLVDQMYARFVDVVVEGRKGLLTREAVRKAADGRVYTAAEAKALRLVDEIGYFGDAVALARQLANVKEARVVTYERKGFTTGRRTIYSRGIGDPVEASVLARGERGDVNVVKLDAAPLLDSPRPSFKYLWLPSVR